MLADCVDIAVDLCVYFLTAGMLFMLIFGLPVVILWTLYATIENYKDFFDTIKKSKQSRKKKHKD